MSPAQRVPGAAGAPPREVGRLRRDWETVMGHYLPGREEMLAAGLDAAERRLGGPPASVLDVGGGPGTTVEAVLRRWSRARVTVLDADPALLALTRAALPQVAVRRADLRDPGWTGAAGGPHDLVLLVMTLHYLPEPRAGELYAQIRGLLRPGGTLLVLDTVQPPGTAPQPAPQPNPQPDPQPGGAWSRWWQDLAEEPALRRELQQRALLCRDMESAEFVAPLAWHERTARAAGFDTLAPVWSRGRHVALAAGVSASRPRG